MNFYLFIRYASTPNREVSAKLGSYINPAYAALLQPLPSGVVISHFASEESLETIKQGMSEIPGIHFDLLETPNAPLPAKNASATPRAAQQSAPRPSVDNSKEGLERQLQAALQAEDFEKAATLRDRITREFPEASNESFITSINEFKNKNKK